MADFQNVSCCFLLNNLWSTFKYKSWNHSVEKCTVIFFTCLGYFNFHSTKWFCFFFIIFNCSLNCNCHRMFHIFLVNHKLESLLQYCHRLEKMHFNIPIRKSTENSYALLKVHNIYLQFICLPVNFDFLSEIWPKSIYFIVEYVW